MGHSHAKPAPKTQAQKEQEAHILGKAALINVVIVVLQMLVLKFLVLSMTLKVEMIHTASDLLVNTGAWWVAYHALTASDRSANTAERRFMYVGLAILVAGAGWTAFEAIERISAPIAIQGGWLIVIGIIGGLGNKIAHNVLDAVPHAERSHKHKLVHLHVIEDMILAGIVVLSGVMSMVFSWNAADPYLSLLAVAWVAKRAFNIYQNLRSGKKLGCCPGDGGDHITITSEEAHQDWLDYHEQKDHSDHNHGPGCNHDK